MLLNKVAFSFTSNSSEFFILKSFTIEGNKKTKFRIISRELHFTSNDTISADQLRWKINAYVNRLNSTKLFIDVKCRIDTVTPQELHLHFIVEEAIFIGISPNITLADRNFNIWYNDYHMQLSRLNYSLKWRQQNMQGLNRTLETILQFGFNTGASIKYTIPYIGKKQNSTIVATFNYTNARQFHHQIANNKQLFFKDGNKFVFNKIHGEVKYNYRLKNYSNFSLSLGIANMAISNNLLLANPNLLPNQQLNTFFVETNLQYDYAKLDNIVYPLQGSHYRVFYNNKIGISASHFAQESIYFAAFYYLPLPKKYNISVVSRNRFLIGNANAFYFQKALGFDPDYIRGYEYFVMNGTHFTINRLDLKKLILYQVLNPKKMHHLPKLPIWILPKLFTDVGYVKAINNAPKASMNNIPLYSAGLGVDCRYGNIGIIRLEYAMNHLGQKGLFLHLTSL